MLVGIILGVGISIKRHSLGIGNNSIEKNIYQKVQSKPLLLSTLILTNPQNPLRQYVSILSWFHAVIQIFFENN